MPSNYDFDFYIDLELGIHPITTLIIDHTGRVKRIEKLVARVIKEGFNSFKYVGLRCSYSFCEYKEW